MNIDQDFITTNKYMLMLGILNNKASKSFIEKIDNIIVQKRFRNIREYTLLENEVLANSSKVNLTEINKLMQDIISCDNYNENQNIILLQELVKFSNLSLDKINIENFTNILNILCEKLYNVSHETIYISSDFIILKLADNFLNKCDLNPNLKISFFKLRDSILKKISYFNYTHEIKYKENTYDCWIDRVLKAYMENEITKQNFISINHQIIKNISINISVYWKIFNSVTYLLDYEKNKNNNELQKFKNYIQDNISQLCNFDKCAEDRLIDSITDILSLKYITRDDFFSMITTLKLAIKTNNNIKILCINFYKYLIYYDKKYNIFNHNINKRLFIENICTLPSDTDTIELYTRELDLIIEILHIDYFFMNNKKVLINQIIKVLKYLNNGKNKLTHNNFYKYCDIVDFLVFSNPSLINFDIVTYLCHNKDDRKKIIKHFKLSNNILDINL